MAELYETWKKEEDELLKIKSTMQRELQEYVHDYTPEETQLIWEAIEALNDVHQKMIDILNSVGGR